MTAVLHIGLVINPLAGLGGSLGLKGSDGDVLRQRVLEMPPEQWQRAAERLRRAFMALEKRRDSVRISTWGGDMGEKSLTGLDFAIETLGSPIEQFSSAKDTASAVVALQEAGVDVLVFAGGDGTARDIADVIRQGLPVLGIPAGVKMHSGVFAVSPEAAGQLLCQLADGGLVGLRTQEVRDIDEEAFRQDIVRSRYYGELQVPGEGRYLQQTKVGGRESQALIAAEIGAWIADNMSSGTTYLIGPGSTTHAIKKALGIRPTLLGVDVYRDGESLAIDADEKTLLGLLADSTAAKLVVTAIGGQGHIFGRGNQQFSPKVIRAVGSENLMLVAAKSKINALQGRPLLVDTNDPALDHALCGYYRVITGYDDFLLYRVAGHAEPLEGSL